MNKKAYVKEISGAKAVLSIKRECMCAGNENCGLKCFALQSDIIEVAVDNQIGAKAGDLVEVEGKTSAILAYSAFIFILPVFSGLLFYFTAQALTQSIMAPYIVSLAGFIASVVFLYFFLNSITKNKNDFKITKIL